MMRLLTAFVVSYLFLLLCAAALALVTGAVRANDPLLVLPCSRETCEPVPGEYSALMAVTGVTGLQDSPECPGRCSVAMFGVQQIHVMGHWLDVTCRVWPSEFCTWDREFYSHRRAVQELREAVGGE